MILDQVLQNYHPKDVDSDIFKLINDGIRSYLKSFHYPKDSRTIDVATFTEEEDYFILFTRKKEVKRQLHPNTFLGYAVVSQSPELVEFLLKKGGISEIDSHVYDFYQVDYGPYRSSWNSPNFVDTKGTVMDYVLEVVKASLASHVNFYYYDARNLMILKLLADYGAKLPADTFSNTNIWNTVISISTDKHLSSREKTTELVDFCLRHGAPRLCAHNIARAIEREKFGVAAILFSLVDLDEKGASVILNSAIEADSLEWVRLLIQDKGVDPNRRLLRQVEQPAVSIKFNKLVKILKDSGITEIADASKKPIPGKLILYEDELELIANRILGPTPIAKEGNLQTRLPYDNSEKDFIELLRVLVKPHYRPGAPLFFVKSREVLDFLVKSGADIHSVNEYGHSVAGYFLCNEYHESLRELGEYIISKYGARLNRIDIDYFKDSIAKGEKDITQIKKKIQDRIKNYSTDYAQTGDAQRGSMPSIDYYSYLLNLLDIIERHEKLLNMNDSQLRMEQLSDKRKDVPSAKDIRAPKNIGLGSQNQVSPKEDGKNRPNRASRRNTQ